MLLKGGDVKAMGAIVKLMSREELDRGLELARIAGELWTVSDVVGIMDMPVLAEFLEERACGCKRSRSNNCCALRDARAGRRDQTGRSRHRSHGEQEVKEGWCACRCLKWRLSAARNCPLPATLWREGVVEFETAQMAGAVAREAVASGVVEIARGAEEIGAGKATAAMGEALEAQAS